MKMTSDWLFNESLNELFIKVKYTLDEQFYNNKANWR